MLDEREQVRELSEQLVALQRPIRVLDAVSWTDDVEAEFHRHGGQREPAVDAAWYREHRPLAFDPHEVGLGLRDLEARIARGLGHSPVGDLLASRAAEYRRVIDLLQARGDRGFTPISVELYGGAGDELHPGGPTLAELGGGLSQALAAIDDGPWAPPEDRTYDGPEAVDELARRLARVFGPGEGGEGAVQVRLDDGIVADAAAGADYIKLRRDARFTQRDLRVLEVHEGWVHVATSLNGRSQPWCTFLGKGTPSTTATQEGLAVFTELITLSSTPDRLAKITRRMTAIAMAQDGATFVEVHRWLLDQGLDPGTAWTSAVRVFRGGSPTTGPFTKDLVYSRGFIEVYHVIRLAVRRGLLDRLPLLFVGKLAIRELPVLAELAEAGLVDPPAFLPPQVADLRALAAWMAYAHLLDGLDWARVEAQLHEVLA